MDRSRTQTPRNVTDCSCYLISCILGVDIDRVVRDAKRIFCNTPRTASMRRHDRMYNDPNVKHVRLEQFSIEYLKWPPDCFALLCMALCVTGPETRTTQPIRCKTETSRVVVIRVFPRFLVFLWELICPSQYITFPPQVSKYSATQTRLTKNFAKFVPLLVRRKSLFRYHSLKLKSVPGFPLKILYTFVNWTKMEVPEAQGKPNLVVWS